MGVNRFRPTLDLDGAQRLEFEEAIDQPSGRLGDLNSSRRCSLLHSGSHIHRITHGRVLHTEVRPDGTHYHQSGVDPDSDVEFDAPSPGDLLAVGRNGLEDLQTGPHGPLRIVLMRNRGTEERKDGVTHQPRKRSLVAIHGRNEVFESAVHHFGPLLRIHVLGGGGGPLNVAEQHRHGAALTLHRTRACSRLELLHQFGRDEPPQSVLGAGRRRSRRRSRCR